MPEASAPHHVPAHHWVPTPFTRPALGAGAGAGGRQRGLCSRSRSAAAAAAKGPRPPCRPSLRPARQRGPQLRKRGAGWGSLREKGSRTEAPPLEDQERLGAERGALSLPPAPGRCGSRLRADLE